MAGFTYAVLATIRVVAGAGGALLLVKNDTSDWLNFGLASESAQRRGIVGTVLFPLEAVGIEAAARLHTSWLEGLHAPPLGAVAPGLQALGVSRRSAQQGEQLGPARLPRHGHAQDARPPWKPRAPKGSDDL